MLNLDEMGDEPPSTMRNSEENCDVTGAIRICSPAYWNILSWGEGNRDIIIVLPKLRSNLLGWV